MPAIDASELSAEVRARLGLDAAAPAEAARRDRGARASSARSRGGKVLEQQLVATHAEYLRAGRALIRQQSPRTIGAPAVWKGGRCVERGTLTFAPGAAPCDFGGAARGVGAVLFDAKGVTGRATYEHDPDQYHQLEELREHQHLGLPWLPARAFLLLADQRLGLAYLVEHLQPLLAREPLPLRTGRGAAVEHRWPVVRRTPSGTWDWLTVLRETDPLRDFTYSPTRPQP